LVTGDSTATTGNVLKGGVLFIHNFGTNNTFIGKGAGNLTTTGLGGNTAAGFLALSSNTTGFSNTALGANALQLNTTGLGNTAVGSAVLSATTGSANTGIGSFVLQSNTTGAQNTATGYSALLINTTGSSNTATGLSALGSNSTGAQNTADGTGSLTQNTTGDYNTAAGTAALFSNTTGSFNTAIGFGADVASGNLTNATAIGNGAVVNASNKIQLGNSAVTVIEAQVGLTVVSDRNKKENFRALIGEDVLRKIRGLNVMSWNYIGQDPRQFRHYGPVAQEFFAAFGHDGLGMIGTGTTINSSDLEGILTISVQALEKRSQALQAENADLNKEISSLKARLEALERLLANLKGAVDQ
jgi:hypothetical protein